MKTPFKSWIVRALALLFAASAAFAQDRVPFRQEELDQMLAPVALYPDSLLSQMLMASTYPLEVVQAARWSRANPGLKGQDAVRAVERMDWDPSVKSLTAFPQVLNMMDEKLEWTERLGEAFLAQQADVMDTVQGLRRRAEAAGTLRSNEQMRVARQGEVIVIQPPAPEVVYVPYYSPLVVYGPWWWPAYPPVYWAPPPYYVVPAHRPAFIWGSGIVISAGFFFGHFDWPHRHVKVVPVRHHHPDVRPTHVRTAWRHDPVHRRGVPFRHAEARQQFERSRVAGDARRDWHGNDVARTQRRADDRSADIRLRRWEERRDAAQERRESAGNRVRPDHGSNRAGRAAGSRDDDRVRPAPLPETRITQTDRNVQPGRSAPQVNDRRWQRGDAPRPQTRSTEQRPAVVAPVVRSDPRPAATAPAIRTETRQAPEGRQGAEALTYGQPARATLQQHHAVREIAPASRPAASVPNHAPRMESDRQGGDRGGRAHGNPGRQRPGGSDNSRKS